MKEPLEDFFRKKLNSDKEEGWNTPSDDIWEKALPHFIEEEPKKKLLIWFWLAAIFLFVLGVGLWFLYPTQVKTKKSTAVKVMDVSPAEKKLNVQDLPDTNIAFNETMASFQKIPQNVHNDELKIRKKLDSKLKHQSAATARSNKNTIAYSTPPIVSTSTRKQTNLQKIFNLTIDKLAADNTTPVVVLKPLDKLPMRMASIEVAPQKIENVGISIIDIKPAIPKRIMLYVEYLPSMSRLDIVPSDEQIFSSKQYHFANNFLVGIKKELNKNWSLKSGVGLNSIISKTMTKKSLVYDKSAEYLMANDMIANPISFQANSPFGEYEMSTMVTMPTAKPVPEGDEVDAYLFNNQIVRYLFVPIEAQYQKKIFKKTAMFLDAGVSYNHLVKEDTRTTGMMMHKSDEMSLNVMKSQRMTALTKSVFSASIGLGLTQKISTKFSVFSSLNFEHSLTPVMKSSRQKTGFSSWHLGVGAGYYF